MPIYAITQLKKHEGSNRKVHDISDHPLIYPAGVGNVDSNRRKVRFIFERPDYAHRSSPAAIGMT
jgi:hypothetical protein